MECHEIEEMTGLYLADQLTVQERFRMEMHLNTCTSCASDLADFAELSVALHAEFDSENCEPSLDPHRHDALAMAWKKSTRLPLNTSRATWRSIRRVAVSLAAAAAVVVGSYLGFVSGHQRVQPEALTVEIAALNSPVQVEEANNPIDAPDYGISFTGIPTPDMSRIVNNDLPEYGMGSALLASRSRVSSTRAPYVGLPVPRPNYDFTDTSLGNE